MRKIILVFMIVISNISIIIGQPCPSPYSGTFGLTSTQFIQCITDSISFENIISNGSLDSCKIDLPDGFTFGWNSNMPSNFKHRFSSWRKDSCGIAGSIIYKTATFTGYQKCNGQPVVVYIGSVTFGLQFEPFAEFNFPDTVCINEPITLINASCNYSNPYWDLGNGTNSNLINPASYSFSTSGSKTIQLTVDPIGCGSTQNKVHQIYVRPLTTINPTLFLPNCGPDSAYLQQLNLSEATLFYTWTAVKLSGSGSVSVTNSHNSNVKFYFTGPGKYVIKITVPNSCPAGLIWTDTLTLGEAPVMNVSHSIDTCYSGVNFYLCTNHFNTPNTTQTNKFYLIDPNGVISFIGLYNGTIPAIPINLPLPGTYFFVDTSETSCGKIRAIDSIKLIVQTNLGPFGNDTLCAGTSLLLPDPQGASLTLNGVSISNPYTFTTLGVNVVTYTPLCGSVVTKLVYVRSNPQINFPNQTTCSTSGTLTLSATPTPGTFSGMFVFGNTFDISAAGIGQHQVYYTVTDSIGCTSAVSATMTVSAPANITYSGSKIGCLGSPYEITTLVDADISMNGITVTNDTLSTLLTSTGYIVYTITNGSCFYPITDSVYVNSPVSNTFGVTPHINCGSTNVSLNLSGSINAYTTLLIEYPDNSTTTNPTPSSYFCQSSTSSDSTYNFSATISPQGCPTVVLEDSVTVYAQITPALSSNYQIFCPSQLVSFMNGTINQGQIDSVNYFINGIYAGNNWNLPPRYFYAADKDSAYDVVLTIYPKYCPAISTTLHLLVHPSYIPLKLTSNMPYYCAKTNFWIKAKGVPPNSNIAFEDDLGNIYNTNGVDSLLMKFTVPGIHYVKVKVFLCGFWTDSIKVEIYPTVTPVISSNFKVCPGQETYFTNLVPPPSLFGIFWDHGDGTSNNNSTTHTHIYPSPGTYSCMVITTSDQGCLDTLKFIETVLKHVDVDFIIQNPNNCGSSIVYIQNNSVNDSINTWILGNGNTYNLQNPSPQNYDSIGQYSVTLIVTNNEGCVDSLTKTNCINIYEVPIAKATILYNDSNGVVKFGSDSSILAISYKWDFDDDNTSYEANPTHIFTEGKTYKVVLTVYSKDGCVSSDTLEITIHLQTNFYFPKAFTPNNDSRNDHFGPALFNIMECNFKIFNRWGMLIFEGKSVNDTWDGSYKGQPCPQGYYFYKASIKNANGIYEDVNGGVTLIR